jgi:hypothetical protein
MPTLSRAATGANESHRTPLSTTPFSLLTPPSPPHPLRPSHPHTPRPSPPRPLAPSHPRTLARLAPRPLAPSLPRSPPLGPFQVTAAVVLTEKPRPTLAVHDSTEAYSWPPTWVAACSSKLWQPADLSGPEGASRLLCAALLAFGAAGAAPGGGWAAGSPAGSEVAAPGVLVALNTSVALSSHRPPARFVAAALLRGEDGRLLGAL